MTLLYILYYCCLKQHYRIGARSALICAVQLSYYVVYLREVHCFGAKLVRTTHFRSHEVFRGDLIPYSLKNAQLSLDFFDKLKRAGAEPARHF